MTSHQGLRLPLAGGGTGGHLVPGLHLLSQLVRRAEEGQGPGLSSVVWFTSGRAVEERVLEGLESTLGGIPCERVALPVEPDGGGAPSLLRTGVRMAPAAARARRAMRAARSEVLLGLGGFVCAPAVLAARSRATPAALLEINAQRGKATRLLSPLCSRMFHAWTRTMPDRPGRKHLRTGPPLAPGFVPRTPDPDVPRAARRELGFDPERPLLLVLGGSQGAAALNRFVAEEGDVWLESGIQVLHQTGPGRLEEGGAPRDRQRTVEYLDDVPTALRAATLVLCRGGASTIAEVGAVGVPAWVVPYPHHQDRHQEYNARELGGGVRLVPEGALDRNQAKELGAYLGSEGHFDRERMATALQGCVPVDAADRVLDELTRLARR